MISLESQGNSNTNRYANRGGQLLKEEKERKAVQKVSIGETAILRVAKKWYRTPLYAQELPKVETSLEKMIAEIEEKTGKQFTYNGRPLLEMIAELWEQRRKEKENEKESRVSYSFLRCNRQLLYTWYRVCCLQKIQSRVTPLKPNNLQTPASSVQKRGKVLGAVENTNVKKPTSVRRELKVSSSCEGGGKDL